MDIIFDIEANGLLDKVTKIHCLSYTTDNGRTVQSITDLNQMKLFLSQENLTLIGHNIIRYDIPTLEKILGIKINAKFIDTLALSWYLYPTRLKHGLEIWGEEFGIPKPKIDNWEDLPVEEYVKRCEEDVKINSTLYVNQQLYLRTLYGETNPLIVNYLSFKMDCAREQEEIKWRLDVDLCNKTLDNFVELKETKKDNLVQVMPLVNNYTQRAKPKKLLKKDGTLTSLAKRWFTLLESENLPLTHSEPVDVLSGVQEANPNSNTQKKDWLMRLGWIPETFEYVKDSSSGLEREVPQIYNKNKEVCRSIKKMYEAHPELENLESYSLLSHRIGILKGFLNNVDEEGFLKAEIRGLTNTLRFKHTTIVNLPKVSKPFSADLRACLIAPDDSYELCGSDMSSLEDNTKKHYMWSYDPDYVTEMSRPGYDPHLGIGVFAGLISQEDVNFFKRVAEDLDNEKEVSSEDLTKYKAIGIKRNLSKTVNFAGVYGAGPPKIAKTSGMSLQEARDLHKAYWDLNWSVKQIGKDVQFKTVGEQMWLYNPVSKFWYSLRYEKDKFSTLNQGTGVYCFDSFVKEVRNLGYKVCGQFHDEVVVPYKKENKEKLTKDFKTAIQAVNNRLKLNVELGISIQSGMRYSEIH